MFLTLRQRRGLAAMAGTVAALAALAAPTAASAATSTESLALTGGSLSIGTLTAPSLSGSIGATVTGNLPYGNWSDATGSGSGWNGTIALSLFHYQSAWTQTLGTTTALGSTTSGNYTGSGEGSYTVTITSFTSPTLQYSYAGLTSGTGSATLGVTNTTSTIASGVTITWGPTTTTYAAGMAYSIKVGNLPATALSLNNASGGSIVATGGTTSPNPTFTNTTATPAEGSGADPTQTVGASTKFITAAVNQGAGTYTVTPSATITSDAYAWAATYVAQVTYTIVSGP